MQYLNDEHRSLVEEKESAEHEAQLAAGTAFLGAAFQGLFFTALLRRRSARKALRKFERDNGIQAQEA